MKQIFYCLFISFCIVSCDDSDENHAITDYEGLAIEIMWDETGAKNADGIGLVIYDPQGVLIYAGQDSLAIFHSLMDGQYVCEVFTYKQVDKTDYKIEVQGLNDKAIHTFTNSFSKSDTVGFKKRSLLILKNKERYTVDVP